MYDGNWHHVAVTVDRLLPSSTTGKIQWYHNGSPIAFSLTDNAGLSPGSLANNSPLRVGTRTAATSLTGWFQGDLDELEIFNRVLSSSEVKSIFNAGPFGKCK